MDKSSSHDFNLAGRKIAFEIGRSNLYKRSFKCFFFFFFLYAWEMKRRPTYIHIYSCIFPSIIMNIDRYHHNDSYNYAKTLVDRFLNSIFHVERKSRLLIMLFVWCYFVNQCDNSDFKLCLWIFRREKERENEKARKPHWIREGLSNIVYRVVKQVIRYPSYSMNTYTSIYVTVEISDRMIPSFPER